MDHLSTDPIGIKSFIATRERAIQRISEELSEEKERVKNSDYAIADLEVAIPEAKKALKLEQDSLTSLLELRAHFQEIEGSQTTSPPSRGQSAALSRFRAQMARPASRSLLSIEAEMKVKIKQIQEMRNGIREMETELDSWKQLQKISRSLIQHLSGFQVTEEDALAKAKTIMKPINRVSEEIWIRIFEMFVFTDFQGYLGSNAKSRPVAFILTQVCRNWRRLVIANQVLWKSIFDPILQTFENNNDSFMKIHVEQDWISMISAHAGRVSWGLECADPLNPNRKMQISSEGFNLDQVADFNHLCINSDHIPLTSGVEIISEPIKTFILSSQRPMVDKIFKILVNWPSIDALCIVNGRPELKKPLNLSSMCPQLTKLALRVKTFPPAFKIAGFLTPTLQELYIQDEDGHTASLDIPKQIVLSNLSTLGITISASPLLKDIRVSSLRTLILYGPTSLENFHFSMIGSIKAVIHQLSRLEFHDWEVPGTAVMVFRSLVLEMKALRSVKFLRSHIDGESLILALNSAMEKSESFILPNLGEMVLSNVTGITKDQCERLKPLVRRLKIYV